MKVVTEVKDLDEILTLKLSEFADYVGSIKELIEARHVFTKDNNAFVAITLDKEEEIHKYPIHKYCEDFKSDKRYVKVGLEQRGDNTIMEKNIKKEKVMGNDDILTFVKKGGNVKHYIYIMQG